MRESRARVLLKWRGRDRATDQIIAARTWALGRQLLLADTSTGSAILRASHRLAPSTRRRLFLVLADGHIDPRWWRAAFSLRTRLRGEARTHRGGA